MSIAANGHDGFQLLVLLLLIGAGHALPIDPPDPPNPFNASGEDHSGAHVLEGNTLC